MEIYRIFTGLLKGFTGVFRDLFKGAGAVRWLYIVAVNCAEPAGCTL
jgi:hypothetical protein